MFKLNQIGFIALFGSLSLFVDAQPLLNWNDFAAQPFLGKYKALSLDNNTRQYKTIFAEMSRQKINFAGYSVLQTVGCGGGCSQVFIYNAKSGKATIMPDSFADCYSSDTGFVGNDVEFRKYSTLIKATGRRHIDGQCEIIYYQIVGDTIQKIQAYPYPKMIKLNEKR